MRFVLISVLMNITWMSEGFNGTNFVLTQSEILFFHHPLFCNLNHLTPTVEKDENNCS